MGIWRPAVNFLPFPMAQMLAGSQTGTVLRVFRE